MKVMISNKHHHFLDFPNLTQSPRMPKFSYMFATISQSKLEYWLLNSILTSLDYLAFYINKTVNLYDLNIEIEFRE